MDFLVLSHATLCVRGAGRTLLVDPWLYGSCYWRSWWNYPPVDPALADAIVPDAVYLTHVHWDHFHGPTLRRYPRETPVLIPMERSTRMRRDLEALGFRRVIELAHGRAFRLADDFVLTSWQFSPWGDSALAIECEGVKLLDANDAKFMGAPLRQLMNRHGRFDFAFRSHSSANDRACYRYVDAEAEPPEDGELYAASFYRFMERVAPRYAVPFASNHCHLHRDTVGFNDMVATPDQVRRYVRSRGGLSRSELRIMVSGDGWDSNAGFSIKSGSWFTDRPRHLADYAARERERLEATYRREARVRVRPEDFDRFFVPFCRAVPRLLRRSFRGVPIYFVARRGDEADCFRLDVHRGTTAPVAEAEVPEDAPRFETAARVLKDAMARNMFSHVGISKRVVYRSRRADAKHLHRLNQLLAAYEYEVLPLSGLFRPRTVLVYARRWRELLLYAQLLVGLRAGKSPYQLEAEQLS